MRRGGRKKRPPWGQLNRENTRLRAENLVLRREIAGLNARIAHLERQVGQNSRNSSKPPSSDAPSAPVRPKKSPSGRKPGGQPGHARHNRELLPVEKVDQVVPLVPQQCRGCGASLKGEDPDPGRYQVTEIPVVRPEVTEYRLHTLSCPNCCLTTTAKIPDGVGMFGPRCVAILSLLTGFYHLSRRQAVGALEDLFGVKMSLGAAIGCERMTSEALKIPAAQAQSYVQKQGVKHADETSWPEGIFRKKAWLWVAVTPQVAVFLVRASRGTNAAKDLLGKVLGVLVSDRWCAYSWWPLSLRQLCWAHLKRHFQAFAEWKGRAGKIGEALLKEERLLFQWWHRVRDGTLARSTFRAYVAPLRKRVKGLLLKGTSCGVPKMESMCREILTLEKALWTFVRLEGVEPTNNAAERALRSSVIWRKICFGTHSERGSRFVERIMTAACTLKLQERNIVDYVAGCVTAASEKRKPHSLLPQTAQQHSPHYALAA